MASESGEANVSTAMPARIETGPAGTAVWLTPSKALPRSAVVRVNNVGLLQVYVYAPKLPLSQPLAYAGTSIEDCRLDEWHEHESLWVGSASFDLTTRELQRIRETFPQLRVTDSSK